MEILLKDIWEALIGFFPFLERKFWRVLIGFLNNPREVVLTAHDEPKQEKYTTPYKYFVGAYTVYFLIIQLGNFLFKKCTIINGKKPMAGVPPEASAWFYMIRESPFWFFLISIVLLISTLLGLYLITACHSKVKPFSRILYLLLYIYAAGFLISGVCQFALYTLAGVGAFCPPEGISSFVFIVSFFLFPALYYARFFMGETLRNWLKWLEVHRNSKFIVLLVAFFIGLFIPMQLLYDFLLIQLDAKL